MDQSVFVLFLGFFIGLKHAIEADHLIAVSTIVSEYRNPFKSALIGTFWGIGHSASLFIAGLLVLLLNISIPQNLSLFFEIIVGFMLIVLGIGAIKGGKYYLHRHKHLHKKSFIVGMIHGVAGSGALMLLILSTIKSDILGIFYILLFGIGSIIGMTLLSLFISLPFTFKTARFEKFERSLRIISGIISIIYGIFIVL